MEIALHLGVHYTDGGLVEDCLLANRPILLEQGVSVLRRKDTADKLLQAMKDHAKEGIPPGLFSNALADAGVTEQSDRVVLSAPGLLSPVKHLIGPRGLYPFAVKHLQQLADLTSEHAIEIFLAVRNPASLIPAFLAGQKPKHRETILGNLREETLLWQTLVARINAVWPEARLTVWCDEDTPFIWHRILTSIAGTVPEMPLEKSYDWYDTIMVDGSAAKLAAYMETLENPTEELRQKVIGAFLDRFCDPEKIDMDMSLTGWKDEEIELISERYDADIAAIRNRPDVTFIQP